MIRFIDLRGQDTGYRFGFYNTVTDRFVEACGEYVWDTWEEFQSLCFAHCSEDELERYKKLCPKWVFEKEEEYTINTNNSSLGRNKNG